MPSNLIAMMRDLDLGDLDAAQPHLDGQSVEALQMTNPTKWTNLAVAQQFVDRMLATIEASEAQ